MADKLANLAMDTRRSVQVAVQETEGRIADWNAIYAFVSNDVDHWMQRTSDEFLSRFGASTP
ncbi:hypothetical protein GQ600_205 [Phytophthora cactorum]|nr:hypothetical protein GQ600_205 [Phytophthora cactorum]